VVEKVFEKVSFCNIFNIFVLQKAWKASKKSLFLGIDLNGGDINGWTPYLNTYINEQKSLKKIEKWSEYDTFQ